MIIWGSRGVTSTMGSGNFFCPQCNSDQQYQSKRVRRFFTLYFIPLIPLGEVARYIECRACRGTFNDKVLELDPRVHEQLLQQGFAVAMCDVVLLSAAAAGVRDPGTAAGIVRDLLGHELTPQDVRGRMDELSRQPAALRATLEPVADHINEQGKEAIFRAALGAIARAGSGETTRTAQTLLDELAGTLRMSPAHIRGIMSDAGGDGDR